MTSSSSFDLDTYIANYSSHTRQKRLEFIAAHSESLKRDALQMALEEVKRTSNTTMYNDLIGIAAALDPAYFKRDDNWVETVDKQSAQRLEKLEADLSGHKTSLVKESIRMGHNDLGDFHCERGDFQAALKCYVRTRDYCTTSKHTISMCMNVIKVSIHMGNFTHVSNYVTKAESTPDVSDGVLQAQLRCAAGLALLESKKFKLAARKFLDASTELGNQFNQVLSPQDVALYGGLCALATSDRQELKTKLVENTGFRAFLELFPQVRELVHGFYGSRYASCLSILEKLKPDLLLDIHLHDHVSQLFEMIRSKALIQYFSPFVTVDMCRMATAFNVEVNELERELAQLIMAGQIPARIDSQSKVLHARHADLRHTTFAKALAMGGDYMRDTKALLLRLNLLRADFTVKGAEGAHGPSKSSRQDLGQQEMPRAM